MKYHSLFVFFLKKRQNLNWSSAANYRWRLIFYSDFISDSLIADIQKKITEAFDIFDHESNKTVDVR